MEKNLTLKERRAVIRATSKRYQISNKKQRGLILNEFCATTGYNRSYAAFILRNWGRKVKMKINGIRTIFLFGQKKKDNKRNYDCIYDYRVKKHLEYLWALADGICSKRFVVWLKDTLPILEKFEEVTLDSESRYKLLNISAATIDRLLAPVRKKIQIKGRHTTKPGTLLKHQIPIRTFSEWNENTPGFVEIDLVSHDGGNLEGDIIQTLDVTDICTGWTETRAVKNKAQRWVFEALQNVIKTLPFDLKGIDSDNGGEFINQHLKRFCTENKINFTRSRPYRKNDSCYVEQKNWSVVRRNVGYYRYDTSEELSLLNEIYIYLRLYTNFFQPVMKLISKSREGAKVRKTHSISVTPYKRVLNNPDVPEKYKQELKNQYEQLNPAELKRTISRLQDKLFTLSEQNKFKAKHKKDSVHIHEFSYI